MAGTARALKIYARLARKRSIDQRRHDDIGALTNDAHGM